MTLKITKSKAKALERNFEKKEDFEILKGGENHDQYSSYTVVNGNDNESILKKNKKYDSSTTSTVRESQKDSELSEMPDVKISTRKEDSGEENSGANTSKSVSGKRKLGRRGDPRMHRAVAARLRNPTISLLDALLHGGFVFPHDTDDEKGLNGHITDLDNVQLCQRKNQLSRRLRLARQSPMQGQRRTSESRSSKQDNEVIYADDEEELANERSEQITRFSHPPDKEDKYHNHSPDKEDHYSYENKRSSESSQDSGGGNDSKHEVKRRKASRSPSHTSNTSQNSASYSSHANRIPPSYRARHRPSISVNASKFHNPYLNPSSGDILSTLKATAGLPPALALQHQHLLLQRQAALQDSQALSVNPYSHAGSVNIGDMTPGVNPDSSLYLNTSSAITDIENAIRQHEMARIVATAKIFANSARKSANLRRDSFSLRHSLTGGVLQGEVGEGAQSDDDPSLSFVTYDANEQEEKHHNARRRQSRRQSHCAAIAHAHHLHKGGSVNPSSILKQTLSPSNASASAVPNVTSSSSTSTYTSSSKVGSAMSMIEKSVPAIDHSKMGVALDIFRAENASLMKRCLLLAGFEGPQTEECSILYLEFLSKVIKVEEKRLSNLCNFFNSIGGDIQLSLSKNANGSVDRNKDNKVGKENNSDEFVTSKANKQRPSLVKKKGASSKHRSSHAKPMESKSTVKPNNSPDNQNHRNNKKYKRKECLRREGRHIHRLDGKCGHKAIIHKPDNAPAHVDFVVDGKVECYQNMQPVIDSKLGTAAWPSRLLCESKYECIEETPAGAEKICASDYAKFEKFMSPEILEDVDFNTKEWGDSFMSFTEANDEKTE